MTTYVFIYFCIIWATVHPTEIYSDEYIIESQIIKISETLVLTKICFNIETYIYT